MRKNVIIEIPAGTLQEMTVEQFRALKGIVAEGQWEHVEGSVRASGNDPLGVQLPDIFVGIERDGYTHS